jgi:tol-pal system protein YbgF
MVRRAESRRLWRGHWVDSGTSANLHQSMDMPQGQIRFARFAWLALVCVLGGTAAQAQDAADLVTRLDRLEATVRDLTGQIEQLQYRNQQLAQQLQALQEQRGGPAAAASPRPNQPYAARPPEPYPAQPQYAARPAEPYPAQPQYGARPNPQYSSNVPYPPPPAPVEAGQPEGGAGRHDAFNPALNPGAPGAPRALGSSTNQNEPPAPRQAGAPLDLAHLSGPADNAASGGPVPPPPANPNGTGAVAALPPAATPKDDYELAHSYFVRKDYANAVQAYSAFLHKYPSDRLAPEAQYWLGESLFQRQQYHDAAEAFLAVSTKYETTARAPDALLRLGQSLAALGEKEAACASLGEVLRKYPRASLAVKQNVEREQKRAHC